MDPRASFGIGRYEITPIEDDEWWGYWHAFLDGVRINGGVCRDYTDGTYCARQAIARTRENLLHEHYYWDHETCDWVRKGDLPPL